VTLANSRRKSTCATGRRGLLATSSAATSGSVECNRRSRLVRPKLSSLQRSVPRSRALAFDLVCVQPLSAQRCLCRLKQLGAELVNCALIGGQTNAVMAVGFHPPTPSPMRLASPCHRCPLAWGIHRSVQMAGRITEHPPRPSLDAGDDDKTKGGTERILS
jgi:hypothetical protein